LLRAIAPRASCTVVPNGVDLDYFTPAPSRADVPTIVFTGAMDYFPNADAVTCFAQTVFPRVRRACPSARFVIVGKNPARAVLRLRSLDGVQVTGSVPDVRPYLRDAWVAVAPLRVARGVQNKVLEAMAAGLPVVATSKALQGLDARPGRDLEVEDDAERQAAATVRLLGDPTGRARMGGAARRFVEEHHAWAAGLATVDRVVAEVSGVPVAAPSRAGAGVPVLTLGEGRP
jgi:glycosyltransferase involved in cell wall biosynthesis